MRPVRENGCFSPMMFSCAGTGELALSRALVKPERGGRVGVALGVCKTLREKKGVWSSGKD